VTLVELSKLALKFVLLKEVEEVFLHPYRH
jgi:hypothetical protein